jgi:predicted heme/steroid binding protein
LNGSKEFTSEELAKFDGKEGRPAYVAVHGFIYDVTAYIATTWAGGIHFDIMAGTDASDEFDACHNHAILEKLGIVGKLVS